MESRLASKMKSAGGALLGRPKGQHVPFAAWHRDIAQCWSMLVGEAISATQATLGDDKEALEALDTIAKMLILIYSESVKDNYSGMCHFKELYEYLGLLTKEDQECPRPGGLHYVTRQQRQKVYSTFTAFLTQTFFCYMFTSRKMAVGTPQDLASDIFDHTAVMNVLAVLDADTRTKALTQLQGAGYWPTDIDYSPLLRRLECFLDVIREEQQQQYAEMEDETQD